MEVWRRLLLVLQLVLLMALRSIAKNVDLLPCEPKFAILDSSDNQYTITFNVCVSKDSTAACYLNKGSSCEQSDCSGIHGTGQILDVHFIGNSCKGIIEYQPNNLSVREILLTITYSHVKINSDCQPIL